MVSDMTHAELIAFAVNLLAKAEFNSIRIEENRPTLSYNNGKGSVTTEPASYEFFTITGTISKKEGD